jgi:D-alanyl-D-alanine dipeptidase
MYRHDMMRSLADTGTRCAVATATGLAIAVLLVAAAQADSLPKDFVFLRDVDASIVQDMRYAGSGNFVGHPLPGYEAAQCVLKRAAAEALKKIQNDLAAHHLSLKVFDCYRPVRAVRAMVRWVEDKKAAADARYFPRTQKSALIRQGYIASRSGHSTGMTVDLTLTRTPSSGTVEGVAGQSCVSDRPPPGDIDMGTRFDCFDPASATSSMRVGGEQRQWRKTLVSAMARHGFQNYAREWWHFSFPGGTEAFDFPIQE